ncbi:MAG: lysylphosphatidylglycerol synthase transmembrane domain-containing protein [Robiginitalea sp.]
MFYNLFLPGGIGGDAYKGYLLHRTFKTSGKKLAAVLLLDRISGLFLLYVYSGILLLWQSISWMEPYRSWIGLVLVLSLFIYWKAHQKWFSYLASVFWPSLGYSALVQLAQLGAAFFILQALGIQEHVLQYLLVFLLSSIVAVLPITIGGIGSREIVFYYGARWLSLQESTSIGISMAFFLITALVSLSGIIYHFRKPGLQLREVEGP